MESIICKNCNGNQFDISGGRYVCKFCGTVFIDKEKSKTERLYLLARRAKDENNAENAVKYYEMILPDDPLNWEPAFYSAYFKARDTTIKDIGSSAYTMSKSLDSIMMIVSTDNITDQEKESIVIEVADKIMDEIMLKDFTKCLVLRMRAVPAMDATAMNALLSLQKKCASKGVHLILSHVNSQPLEVMKKSGFYDAVGSENFCAHIDEALSLAARK